MLPVPKNTRTTQRMHALQLVTQDSGRHENVKTGTVGKMMNMTSHLGICWIDGTEKHISGK